MERQKTKNSQDNIGIKTNLEDSNYQVSTLI